MIAHEMQPSQDLDRNLKRFATYEDLATITDPDWEVTYRISRTGVVGNDEKLYYWVRAEHGGEIGDNDSGTTTVLYTQTTYAEVLEHIAGIIRADAKNMS